MHDYLVVGGKRLPINTEERFINFNKKYTKKRRKKND